MIRKRRQCDDDTDAVVTQPSAKLMLCLVNGESKLLHREDAAVCDDGHKSHAIAEQIASCLKGNFDF